MTAEQRRVVTCHRCPARQMRGTQLICTDDDAPCVEHAADGYCPRGAYKMGLGDTIAAALHRAGIQQLAKRFVRECAWPEFGADGEVLGCKCPSRQKALNRAMPAKG